MAMSEENYNILDSFVKTVIKRLSAGECNGTDAVADLMHPLTAWDKDNQSEFVPWMQLYLEKWNKS